MNNKSIELLELSIYNQCDIFFISVEYIKEYYKNTKSMGSGEVWYHIQSFLTSSANISKLLWGVNKQICESRVVLREKLGVSENSSLKSRKMRNFFEHFDEHIERWVEENPNSDFVDSNIGPKSMFGNLDKSKFLRHFDPTPKVITFKNYEFDMEQIEQEVYEIFEKVKEGLNF
ncbi:hypothetical protein [Bacillus atrophaeus]|uniref:hypothetical protein n=1 Tax=Bacillus atrophaeus TaxID=1452 RepID=UPI002281A591|nr:hypothetical protein [Bacillus atrophaeus]MCY8932517.1 hypothetical protein [Bacillus atrophaeus]MCY8940328.1 hypothetical protein [Bacillus atrophaeus]